MKIIYFSPATAAQSRLIRNNFSLLFMVTTSVIIAALMIERSHSADQGNLRVTVSRIESKETADKLDEGNIFVLPEYNYRGPLNANKDNLATFTTPISAPLSITVAPTSAHTPCHLLHKTAPGVYGSTESGKVVEVPFQYDVVTNTSLPLPTHEEIRKSLEMELSYLLVEALMPSCQGGIKKSPIIVNKSRIFGQLGGVSCFPADKLRSERVDTEDGHLCSPMNGAVSVYFINEDIFDEEYEVESTIERIFENGQLNSVHTEILETHYRPKIDEPSSAPTSSSAPSHCDFDLIEKEPGVYGDCKKGTVVVASFQYDIVTNPVLESRYEKIIGSLEMELSYLLSRDLVHFCRNNQRTRNRSRRLNELGGVSCYPADELESDRFNTEDGHVRSPMKGSVSVYFLKENISDEELQVQRTIKKIMENGKLIHVDPDIVAVKYLSKILSKAIIPFPGDEKVETQSWIQKHVAGIGAVVAGAFVATLLIGFLVMKQKKKSSQIIDDASKTITFLDGTRFELNSSATTTRSSFTCDEKTVKRSNRRLMRSKSEVSDDTMSDFELSIESFDSIYENE